MKLAREAVRTIVERQFMAMGTAVLVGVVAEEDRHPDAERALGEVERLLVEFGRDGWAWGSGALASFNRALALGNAARVPRMLQPLFERAWEIRQASDGWFEPRVGELVRLWGFDDATRLRSVPPDASEVAALLATLRAAPPYDGEEWYGPALGVAWDLGGIGKGYIVDAALDWLCERGFADAIVNAGGNVAVRGTRGERSWRIGIRDPRVNAELPTLLASLEARDESIITHGDDQRFFEYEGRRYAHILHPGNGEPVRGLRSLTVVHPDGALADGGGAALFAAGPERWRSLAARLGIEQVLAVIEDGSLLATAKLACRLQDHPGTWIEPVP